MCYTYEYKLKCVQLYNGLYTEVRHKKISMKNSKKTIANKIL